MIVGASSAILDANEGTKEYERLGYGETTRLGFSSWADSIESDSLVCQKQIEQSSGNRGRSDRLGLTGEKQNVFVVRTEMSLYPM